jgi:rSAM/selenodomain-associated transferase 1
MAPDKHLMVMVRASRLGAVKRRLARDIGDAAARRFQVETTAAMLRRLAGEGRWRTLLAVTPDRYAVEGRFWPAAIPRVAQGPGDLGARMARLLALPPPGPVVIVGSDIPDLRARHVAAAFAALGRHDLVFGPATDGGYWLIGARRRPPPRALFAKVRWSSPHALADTMANVDARFSVALLETLADVDTGADHARRSPVAT